LKSFLPSFLNMEYDIRFDTSSVTIVATMFYSTSTVYLGLSSNLNSNPFLE
jgi:hypothetical protein